MMQYFNDCTFSEPLGNDPQCCDRCHHRLAPDIDYSTTIGDIIPHQLLNPMHIRKRKTPTTNLQKTEVTTVLKAFRTYLSVSSGAIENPNSFIDEECFFSNEDIARISRYCTDIKDTASLQKVLTKRKQITFSPLAPYVSNLITVI